MIQNPFLGISSIWKRVLPPKVTQRIHRPSHEEGTQHAVYQNLSPLSSVQNYSTLQGADGNRSNMWHQEIMGIFFAHGRWSYLSRKLNSNLDNQCWSLENHAPSILAFSCIAGGFVLKITEMPSRALLLRSTCLGTCICSMPLVHPKRWRSWACHSSRESGQMMPNEFKWCVKTS